MTVPAPLKKQPKSYARRMWRCVFKLSASLVIIVCAALLWLNFWLVPRIDNYREPVQNLIATNVGSPVSIGRISAKRNGLLPKLQLSNVHFSNPDGSSGLIIQQVNATLSVKSLLLLKIKFTELHIEKPQVYIQRRSNGTFWIAGIDVTALLQRQDSISSQDNNGKMGEISPAILWLLRQPEITIRQGFVQWVDQMTSAPEFELSNIDASLLSTGRDHRIQLQATPPSDWGERFTLHTTLTEPMLATVSHPRNWDATAYALFPRVDVKALPQHIQLPIQLMQGRGYVEAKGEYKNGALVHSQATLKLPEVEVVTRPDLTPIHLQDFQGTLTATWQKDVLRIQTDDLTFRYAPQTSAQGQPIPEQRWTASLLDVSWQFNEQGQLNGGILQTGEVNLKILSRLALGLPLPEIAQKTLTEMNAQGQIEFLDIQWQGPANAPDTYSFKGQVRDLQATAGKAPPIPAGKKVALGRPGIENLSVSFSINEKQGQAKLEIQEGSVSLPGLYDAARVPINRLQATLNLEHLGNGQIDLKVPDLDLVAEGGELKAQIGWKSPDPLNASDTAGYFTMDGNLSKGNPAFVWRYLPNSIHPKGRAYVKAALIAGTVPQATVHIAGPLADFPYHTKNTGVFLIAGKAENVTYNFAPPVVQPEGQAPWPILTHVQGDAQFTGKGMVIRNATGKILNTPGASFSVKEVSIPDWGNDDTHVLVSANITGPAHALLDTVNQSALGKDLLKDMLSLARVTGDISTQLEMDIMVDRMPDTTVRGEIDLQQHTISLWPFAPELQQAQGKVTFTEKGFSAQNIHAQTLGGKVQGQAEMDISRGLSIDLQGDLTAQGLFNDPNWGKQLLPELNWLDGATTYTFKANYTSGKQVMRWESDLVGLSIRLPEPLDKPAQTAYPLQITLTPLPTDLRFLPLRLDVQTLTEQQNLPYIQASYMLRETDTGVMITQGTLGINQTPSMPITGTTAYIDLELLNTPGWQAFLNALPTTASSSNTPNRTSTSNLVLPIWWPQLTTARIGQLRIGDKFVAHDAQLRIQRHDDSWGADITSQEVMGHLRWYAAGQEASSSGLLQANFTRLWLPALDDGTSEALQTQTSLIATEQQENLFRLLPNTRIHVDHLRLGEMVLGAMELDAQIDQTVVPTRWRINQFDIANAHSTLKAQGYWANTPIPTTSLALELNSTDTGQLLTQLGYEKLIQGSLGTLEGQLSWQALPYAFDVRTLSGELTLRLEKGQVLFADVGVGRLFGVLSLQALPNRLSMDFRDVFQEGLAFNEVEGLFSLNQGRMKVSGLNLSATNIKVHTTGYINLIDHTQQLKTVIVPSLDLGTASLALAVVNPAVGIGSLVAQLVLQEPLKKATTRTYYINGSWDDPLVSKIRSRNTDPSDKTEYKQHP